MYTKKVIEIFKHPHNMGEIKNPDAVGKVGNPQCGDVLELYLKIRNNRIVDVKVKTFGCIAAIVTSSLLTDMIKGKTLEEAKKIKNDDIVKKLDGLPKIKIHCSVLAINALHKAIENYERKNK